MKDYLVDKVIEVIKVITDNIHIDISEQKISITKEMLDVDLSELGVDSIKFVRLIVSLEDIFNCEIPDEKLLFSEMNTVNKIVNVLLEIDAINLNLVEL